MLDILLLVGVGHEIIVVGHLNQWFELTRLFV